MYRTVSEEVQAPEGFSAPVLLPVSPDHVQPGLQEARIMMVISNINFKDNRVITHTKRWAVTLAYGKLRSSYDRLSVRDFTAALDALYAALPLCIIYR